MNESEGAGSPKRQVAPSTQTRKVFQHSADYRHVWLDGEEFSLTAKQADIVRVLHLRFLDEEPWIHLEELRHEADFESDKLVHIFRREPRWKRLIKSDGRGYYRLDI